MARRHNSAKLRKFQQAKHVIQRAWERYDLFISERDINELADRIRNRDIKVIRLPMTNTKDVCLLPKYKGADNVIVVYSRNTKNLLTFLPPYTLEEYFEENINE